MKALRTLIVEDDAMIGGLLAETLEGLGHGVSAVENNVERILVVIRRQCFSLAFAGVSKGPDFFKEIHFFPGSAIVSQGSR